MARKYNERVRPEWVPLALKQANFIHRHEGIADRIVDEAVRELCVTSGKQKKRRSAKTKNPARIYLEDLHLFQYLVWRRSEIHEISQEMRSPDSITELDLIIRYIALIVRKSLRRNSLYGVTGICRFVCRYELNAVKEIYHTLIDNPDKFRTDDIFRTYRKKMREIILERFARYLRVDSAKGKEKHFHLRNNQDESALWQLVAESLDTFQPWQTKCLPRDFNVVEESKSDSLNTTEHLREVKRLHVLTHQDCFKTLTDAIDCDEPSSVLGIPEFFLNDSPPNDFANVSYSTPMEEPDKSFGADENCLEMLKRISLEHSERLANFNPENPLSIKVDGREVAKVNFSATNTARFSIDSEDVELIELVHEKEQLVLAAHFLDEDIWHSPEIQCSYVVRHPHGPRIMFDLKRIEDTEAANRQLLVIVTYKRVRLAQFWFFFKQRTSYGISALSLILADRLRRIFNFDSKVPAISTRHVPLFTLGAVAVVVAALLVAVFYWPTTPSAPDTVATTPATPNNHNVKLDDGMTSADATFPKPPPHKLAPGNSHRPKLPRIQKRSAAFVIAPSRLPEPLLSDTFVAESVPPLGPFPEMDASSAIDTKPPRPWEKPPSGSRLCVKW